MPGDDPPASEPDRGNHAALKQRVDGKLAQAQAKGDFLHSNAGADSYFLKRLHAYCTKTFSFHVFQAQNSLPGKRLRNDSFQTITVPWSSGFR